MRQSILLFVFCISTYIGMGRAGDFDVESQLSEAGVNFSQPNHEVSKRSTPTSCSYTASRLVRVSKSRITSYTYYTSVSYRKFFLKRYRTVARTGYRTETYYELVTQYYTVYYNCYNGGTCNARVCNCLRGWADVDCNTVDGILRLYRGNTEHEGLLEIYHTNRWGSICDDGWNSVASKVACRQMGFSGYTSYTVSSIITNDFWIDDVSCTGNEASLQSCGHSGWGNDNCGSRDGIFLRCDNPVDGTVRLYGGNTEHEGLLEIYYSTRWGSICDDHWNSIASLVACRQLGYSGYTSYAISGTITNDFWIDDVRCSGNEVLIQSCRHSGWGSDNCGTSEGIFLQCDVPVDGSLRLYGENTEHEGLLEIYHSNRWGSICGHSWGVEDSRVACRQMGLGEYASYTTTRTIQNEFWLDHLGCSGNEAAIPDCSNLGWRTGHCRSTDGVYLQCHPSVDGSLRLYGGNTEHEGLLEIYHSNRWGSICGHSWGVEDSRVACRQMGLGEYASYTTTRTIQNDFWLDHLGCSGNEAAITDCSNLGWRTGHCRSTDGVYLQCHPSVDGTLRLNGRTTGNEGILEIYFYNRWSSICDDGWNEVASRVACKQMGFRGSISYSTSKTIIDTFWLDNVVCNGDEVSISSCKTPPLGYHNCGSSEGIFLQCQYSVPTYGCDAITDDGTCFSHFTSRGINWEYARQGCISWDYDLATVKNSQENTLLYATRSSSSSTNCWIGLNDISSEGKFVWSDGSDSLYRNWKLDEPNNIGNQDCGRFYDNSDWDTNICTGLLTCYFCSTIVSQFGRAIGSNYLSLPDNAALTSDTTLFCITENKNIPQVVWSYQDLAKSITSTLSSYTSTTTGVSTLRVYISRPGYYSCRVKMNGGIYKTYTALIADVDLYTADGTLRLYGGSTKNEGILEIFHDNRWGSICDNNWNTVASKIACKQMGFPDVIQYSSGRTITHDYWLDYTICNGNEASILFCYNNGWGRDYCSSTRGVYIQCYPSVTFGRLVGERVDLLENFQTLQHSTTLYCTQDVSNTAITIGWSFTPFGKETEESLTDSAKWESAFGISKLYISTSKLGYYSCHTSKGDVSTKYTVKLTQPASDKGCQGGFCFGVFRTDTAINWATAQSNCMSWGGDLASIRSMGEEEYILSLGESLYGSCWIGHHDRYNEAGNNASLFVSVGGSGSLYRNFYRNEPNENGNEDCVMLRDWNDEGWSDTSCDSTLSCYICGKPNCKDGSCFEVITADTSVNWHSAQYQCEQRGGSLASIRSEPEEKFILSLMTESSSQCWIGLNDRIREANRNPNEFVWEDDNGAVYRHFRNEAINSSTDCVVLSRDDGIWLSAECDITHSCYICRETNICTTGYEFITEQYDCLDINECSVANDCEQICTNTVGSYMCSCRERYYQSNFTSCELIYLNIYLRGISHSTNSIQLSWHTVYRPIDRLSEIMYRVWIRDVTFVNERYFNLKGATSRQEFRISNLLPYRTYEIYTIAVDNETTNKSNIITVQTLTGIPSTSPALTAFSTNPITIRLKLTLPSRETRNGVITGYSIMYSRVDDTLEDYQQTIGVVYTFDITGLLPYSMYKFKAAAATSAGTGVYTEYMNARTMESSPTGTPDIIFLAKSHRSILLKMVPPDASEEINGVITSYTVLYEGIVIDPGLKDEIILVESPEFLTPIPCYLTGLEEGVEYNIQARINTSVGGGPYSSAVTVTTIETVPTGPPLQFTIILQLPTILTLYWTPPELELQNGVITGYLVHYHGLSIDTEERNFTTQSVYVNLTDLEEGALYEISVCALNRAGEGLCVESTNRTREIPPGRPPQNVQVEVNGATSLLVCWDNLLKHEENGIIVKYVITAVGQGHDTDVYEWTANSTARCYTCESLQEANEYRVSMTAENIAGTGPFSSAIVVVTEEDIPSAAPINVFGIGNQNVIVLLWAPPLLLDQNGAITKFEICYFGVTIDRTKYYFQSYATSTIISGLDEGETYHIKVRAYTSKGPGPYSNIVTVSTDESPPSSPPTNVTLTSISSSQILVAWEEPPLADKNGVISSYDISISPSNGQLIQVEASLRTYTLKNLNHLTNYSVRVRARTLPGPGPYCDPVTATTLRKPPVD